MFAPMDLNWKAIVAPVRRRSIVPHHANPTCVPQREVERKDPRLSRNTSSNQRANESLANPLASFAITENWKGKFASLTLRSSLLLFQENSMKSLPQQLVNAQKDSALTTLEKSARKPNIIVHNGCALPAHQIWVTAAPHSTQQRLFAHMDSHWRTTVNVLRPSLLLPSSNTVLHIHALERIAPTARSIKWRITFSFWRNLKRMNYF